VRQQAGLLTSKTRSSNTRLIGAPRVPARLVCTSRNNVHWQVILVKQLRRPPTLLSPAWRALRGRLVKYRLVRTVLPKMTSSAGRKPATPLALSLQISTGRGRSVERSKSTSTILSSVKIKF